MYLCFRNILILAMMAHAEHLFNLRVCRKPACGVATDGNANTLTLHTFLPARVTVSHMIESVSSDVVL
jgi:hypothetical protein